MKDHTRLLLDKASHAIRAARILEESEETEFAAGRLYYAMLYVAEALLYERGLVFRKHSAVHAAYGKEFAKTGRLDPKFHRWLLTAFDARIQGDYHVDRPGLRPLHRHRVLQVTTPADCPRRRRAIPFGE